jgi:hypothetical protein
VQYRTSDRASLFEPVLSVFADAEAHYGQAVSGRKCEGQDQNRSGRRVCCDSVEIFRMRAEKSVTDAHCIVSSLDARAGNILLRQT